MAEEMATLTSRATSGAAWSTASQVFRQLLSIVSVSVLARTVPPSAYGIIGMSAVITNFLDTIRDLGTTNVLVRQPELSSRLIATIFWLNIGIGVFMSLAMISISGLTAAFFKEPALAPVMRALSVNFLFYSIAVVPIGLLSRDMAFRPLAIANMGSATLSTAAGVTAALNGAGVWSLVIASLTNNLVIAIVLWTFCSWRPVFAVDWQEIRSISSYTLNLSGFNLLNYFSRNADNIIVGRFLGSVSLGYYQMAYTLMMYPLMNISSVIAQVLFPAFAQVQDDLARFRSAFIRSCMLVSVITFPIMLGLMVTADPFVRVVLGSRWTPVIPLLIVFAPLGMLQSIFTMGGLIYNARGRTDWLLRWGILSSSAYVLSFFIGLRWGILGVAVSYTITWMLLMYPGFEIPFRLVELRQRDFWYALWPCLQASIGMALAAAGCLYGLKAAGVSQPLAQLLPTVITGALVYTLLLVWSKAPVLGHVADILSKTGNRLLRRFGAWLPQPL